MRASYIIKRLVPAAIIGVLVSIAPLSNVQAATASVFVSPSSSSVTKGSNVTVQVRVNSGTDPMNSAQARINFDSSKLKYVSHSAGDFSTFNTSSTSSSFEYVGAILGGNISGNKRLFSITFKSTNTGTASLSISNAQAANDGSPLSISTSGGSVTVKSSTTTSKPPSGSTTSPKPAPSSPSTGSEPQEEPEVPAIKGKPSFDATSSTITVKLEANKASKVRIQYSTGDEKAQSVSENNAKTKHEVVIGQDKPLQAGVKYDLKIVLTDEDGNKSDQKSYTVRTKGVLYAVKITDKDGQPLANHPVELHSDPVEATTDSQGFAVFDDVTPGEHTLVFEIDGITIRQPVLVGEQLAVAEGQEEGASDTVQLPFRLSETHTIAPSTTRWDTALYAALAGAAVMFVLQSKLTRKLALAAVSRIRKPQLKK